MRCPVSALIAAASLLSAGLPSLGAQSLGEAARQEEQRRKSIKAEAKVYTNKDLPDVPPAAPQAKPTADVPAAAAAAGGDTKAEAGAAKAGEVKATEAPAGEARADGASDTPTRDQAYWSGRLKGLRTTLDRNQTYRAALQSRINGLTTDFVNRDDPAQRAVIAGDRQRAIDELERLTTQVEDDRKAITNLEEEARRAGVPPGWLR